LGLTAEAETSIEDGHLSLKIDAPQYVARTAISGDLSDFRLQVDAQPQTSDAGFEYGIIFRKEDSDNLYRVALSSEAKYAFGKLVKGQWVTLIPWTWSGAIQPDANTLRLVSVGDRIDFYVNDILLFSRTDSAFSHGGMGLYAATDYAPSAEVWYDNFGLYEATADDLVKPTPVPAAPTATPTPQLTWADRLHADLVRTREEYRIVHGWYHTLMEGQSVQCPSPDYALHRPSYEIPAELAALRGIYDRYLATVALVDGVGDVIGPLDRIQLLCSEGKDIGWDDMKFDMEKLSEAGELFDGLVWEAEQLR
jgi:hypothetical protein